LVPAMDTWNRFMDRVHLPGASKRFVDNHPENPDINYFKNPVSGIRELERLMNRVDPLLPEIKQPTLVLQAAGDPVVNPAGSRSLFDRLGAVDKEYTLMGMNRHGILRGPGCDDVFQHVLAFLQRIRRQGSLGSPARIGRGSW